MSTESTPVLNQIDNLRLKQVIRQSCLNFGAVDTARRIKNSPEKLDVLFDLLISEEMVESAYLLAKSFLSEEAFSAFVQKEANHSHFESLDKEELKVSKVKNDLHQKLTGESYDETRKRERAERRQASKEAGAKAKSEKSKAKSSTKEDENGKPPKAQKSTKESKKNNPADSKKSKKEKSAKEETSPKPEKKERVRKLKEPPTESPSGLPYLTLSEYGFTRENYFFVRSIKSFEKISEHFEQQSVIGIDTQFQKGVIQAVSIASEDKVAVFDLSELRENATIIEYLTKILQSDSIEKIAHSFKLDAYYLSKLLGIDGTSINKVIDLSTNIVEETEESVRKIGLNKLAEKYLEKSLNQYYKKSNWSDRPFEQALIDYVALNGFVVLKLFLEYTKSEDHSEPKYFEYEEPSNLPEFKETGETAKRARSENRPSRNPRKNTEERSRRRRTAPKKNAADDTQKERVKKTDSERAPAKKTKFVNEKSDQDTKKHSTTRNAGEAKTGTRPTTRTRNADQTGTSEARPRNRVRGRGGRN
jgi:hypothetical protein